MFQFTFDFVYSHQLSIIIHTASCTKCLTFSPFFFCLTFLFLDFHIGANTKISTFRRRERRKTHRAPISCFCFHFITRFTSKEKKTFFSKTETNFYICFSFYVVQVFPVEGFLFQKQQQQQINGGTKRKWGGKKIPGVSVSFFI